MRPELDEVGISVICEYMQWDVRDEYAPNRLVDRLFELCPNAEEYLLFVSAFGQFAQVHKEDVLRSVRAIVTRFHDNRQLRVAWIEPSMKGNRGWIPNLISMFKNLLHGRGTAREHPAPVSFAWRHPFTDASIQGTAHIISCDRMPDA